MPALLIEDDPIELPDAESDEVPRGSTLRTRTVLVAEDDDALRSLIVAALRATGLAVVGVRDGRELLAQLSRGVLAPQALPFPDALITDLRMPGFSGLEVMSVVRDSGASLPIIAITAFGDPETHQRAMAAGAAVVLDKPFAIRELLSNLSNLLDRPE